MTIPAPSSVCRTKSHFNGGKKYYSFDVATDRGDIRTSIACPGLPSRARAMAIGKKWRSLFERDDFETPAWRNDRDQLWAKTKAEVDPGLKPTRAGAKLLAALANASKTPKPEQEQK